MTNEFFASFLIWSAGNCSFFDLRQQLMIFVDYGKKLKMGHGVLCGSVETTRDISQWLTWPRPENMDTGWVKRLTHERSLTEFWNKIL